MIENNLKKLRKELSLTQKTLSKITGISVAQIVRYENGYAKPSLKASAKLAKVFSADLTYISDKPKTQIIEEGLSKQLKRLEKVVKTEADLQRLTDFIDFLNYKKNYPI
jgi:transcriptional regulator with XRE-family HTH domain